MLGESKPSIFVDNSALAAWGPKTTNRGDTRNPQRRNLWCDHCQRTNHTRETCWKLHGKPANGKENRTNKHESKGFQTSIESAPIVSNLSLNKEQLEKLYKLLTQASSSGSITESSSSHLAQKGALLTALSGVTKEPEPWIIDSGATDHMTGCAKLFSSYTPRPGNVKVKIADGSLSTVAGTGSIEICPNIVHNSVLHVPKLSYNLISISKFTKDHNSIASFSQSFCDFQDLISGRRIGSAREHQGLHFFREECLYE